MKSLLATLVALSAAAALATGSSAAKVAWNEQAKNGKTTIMEFRVDSLTFGKDTWTAHVIFENVSKATITIGNNFGAAIYGDGKSEDLRKAIGFAAALRFSPARPTVLEPGASWSGTIGGDGRLVSSGSERWARVVFGPLRGLPGQTRPVFWVTDHALPLAPTGSSGARGTVI